MSLAEAERYHIGLVLASSGVNVIEASKILKLSRSALYRRLQRYGL